MSILDGIKDKAKELLTVAEPYAVRQTQTYNASKNSIIVAGVVLEGVVNSTINSNVMTRQETGIDYYYTTYYENIEPRTLTITLLPTSPSLQVILDLTRKQKTVKGWFNITVNENGNIVNVYRAWVISLPELSMQQEANDREIVFGIKVMYSGVRTIDQSTDYEQKVFSKYGVSPQDAGSNKQSTINEDTGRVTNYPIINPNAPVDDEPIINDPNIPITPIG